MQHKEIEHDNPLLTLTAAAQTHFGALIAKEFDNIRVNLRITVSDPGTQKADVGITFCHDGEEADSDLELSYPAFNLYVEDSAVSALRDAVIDYKSTAMGGELYVKAPFIKGSIPSPDATLQQRVQYIIDNEINPNLASHGGFVSLVVVEAGGVVVLQFGGGCHGCGMADVTLKSGIEKTLLQCEGVTAVQDVTDHTAGANPYYA